MEVDKREMQIKEKQQFFDSERENNKDMDKKISMAERTTGKMRLDLQDAERAQDQLQSEVSILNTLQWIHTYIHSYLHTYIYTYIHIYMHTYILTYIYTYIHARIHSYINLYLCRYIHAYIHRYIHAY